MIFLLAASNSNCQKDGSQASSKSQRVASSASGGCPDGTVLVNGKVYEPDSVELAEWAARGQVARHSSSWSFFAVDFELEYCSKNPSQRRVVKLLPDGLDSMHPSMTIPSTVSMFSALLPDGHGPVRLSSSPLTVEFTLERGTVASGIQVLSNLGLGLSISVADGLPHGESRFTGDDTKWRGVFQRGKLLESFHNDKPEVVGGEGKLDGIMEVKTGQVKDGLPFGTWKTIERDDFSAFDRRSISFDGNVVEVSTTPNGSDTKRYVNGLREDRQQVDQYETETWAAGYKTQSVYDDGENVFRCSFHKGLRHGSCTTYESNVITLGHYENGTPHGKFVFGDMCDKTLHQLTIANGTGAFRTYDAQGLFSDHYGATTSKPLQDSITTSVGDYCEGQMERGTWKNLTCKQYNQHESLQASYDEQGNLHGHVAVRSSMRLDDSYSLLREMKAQASHGSIDSAEPKLYIVSTDGSWLFRDGKWSNKIFDTSEPCDGLVVGGLGGGAFGAFGGSSNGFGMGLGSSFSCTNKGNDLACTGLPSGGIETVDATFTPCKPAHIKADKVWCQK